jgi:hypothetical protein
MKNYTLQALAALDTALDRLESLEEDRRHNFGITNIDNLAPIIHEMRSLFDGIVLDHVHTQDARATECAERAPRRSREA